MDSLQVFKDYDEGMLLVMQAAALAHSFLVDACCALVLFKARKRDQQIVVLQQQELH